MKINLCMAMVVGSAPLAGAVSVFADNFQGVTPPAVPLAANWQTVNGVVTANNATSFGSATNFAVIAGNPRQLFSRNIAELAGNLSVTTFDFNDQTPANAATPGIQFGLKTSAGDFNNVARNSLQFTMSQGTIVASTIFPDTTQLTAGTSTYTVGVQNSLLFAFNDGASMSYTGPDAVARILGENEASLYINSVFAGTYRGSTDAAAIPATLAFRQFGANATGVYHIDNINVDGIPEPSSIALLSLAGVGLLVRRRK